MEGLLIRVLSRKESAHSVLFQVNAMGAAIFAVPAMLLLGSSDTVSILTICLLGPIAILGQYCFTFGYRRADLAIVAPAGYSWIVFATSIGILLGEPFPASILLATFLIVANGLLLVLDQAQHSRLDRGKRAPSTEPSEPEPKKVE